MAIDNVLRKPGDFVYKFLTNGSSINMNVNGSVTPVNFYFQVPTGKLFEFVRMNVIMVDGAIGYNEFAGLGATLTNGLEIKILDSDGSTLLDPTDGQNIKANSDWGALSGVDNLALPTAGDDSFPIRWTIEKAGDAMALYPGQKINVKVQDDLTGITRFKIMVQGIYSKSLTKA